MDSKWRRFTKEDVFQIVRQTRGGKYMLLDKFGDVCFLPKRNLEAFKKPIRGWTSQQMVDGLKGLPDG
jgi:hypothetical protein